MLELKLFGLPFPLDSDGIYNWSILKLEVRRIKKGRQMSSAKVLNNFKREQYEAQRIYFRKFIY